MTTHFDMSKQGHDHLDASKHDHERDEWRPTHLRRDVKPSKFFLLLTIIVYKHSILIIFYRLLTAPSGLRVELCPFNLLVVYIFVVLAYLNCMCFCFK
jgi:hypothetical protein